MPPRNLSVRDIARSLNLSKATVANALNGTSTVATSTRERVLGAAAKMGYRHNPMMGAFMSAIRRSRRAAFQGTLATVEILEARRPPHGPFHSKLLQGCTDAALAFGFSMDSFQVRPTRASANRLNSILKARGIRGVVILPTWQTPDFSQFDWSFLTGVYADYITEKPKLNTVCCDHYRSIIELLQQLKQRGYRRPGVVLEKGRDERLHNRTVAALRSFQGDHPKIQPAEPLIFSTLDDRSFSQWLKRQRPDVVISHNTDDIDRLEKFGYQVPRDVGYVLLNHAKAKRPCAGLNLHPDQIGKASVEILIGQIQRQDWGLPKHPNCTMVMGELVEGPSINSTAISYPESNRS
jgi:LacI family transcriptional regulator